MKTNYRSRILQYVMHYKEPSKTTIKDDKKSIWMIFGDIWIWLITRIILVTIIKRPNISFTPFAPYERLNYLCFYSVPYNKLVAMLVFVNLVFYADTNVRARDKTTQVYRFSRCQDRSLIQKRDIRMSHLFLHLPRIISRCLRKDTFYFYVISCER